MGCNCSKKRDGLSLRENRTSVRKEEQAEKRTSRLEMLQRMWQDSKKPPQ